MRAFFVVSTLLISLVSEAQYNPVGAITMWTDGYVVTMQNDTIRGQVRAGSLVNDSPAGIVVRTSDQAKVSLKGENLKLIAQRLPDFAYSTSSVPRDREMIIFERVPNPRRKEKPMLLERLTPFGGSIALYFDVAGWKKTTEYTFGNFVFETNRQDLSYIALKNGSESFLVKRSELETIYDRLFGDCPTFVRSYPTATRRDWPALGELVSTYNQLCQ